MCGNLNITTNANGIPYLRTTNVTAGSESVDFALGFRGIRPVGLLAVNIANPIPDGAEDTLPVRLTLNGTTRNLTFFNGVAVTAADIPGTGVILVFNDRYNGILQVVSIVEAPAASAAAGS